MFSARQTGRWVCRACRNQRNQRRQFGSTLWRWQGVEGFPPGLVLRAKKMAIQHAELERKAAAMTEYTPQSIQIYKRISELAEVAAQLKELEETQKVIQHSATDNRTSMISAK